MVMGMAKEKLCGDCIHADICKKVNGSWYHPKNIAYCTAFKERKNCVEVVRCKDCKHYFYSSFSMGMKCKYDGLEWGKDDFCSCGEMKGDGNA